MKRHNKKQATTWSRLGLTALMGIALATSTAQAQEQVVKPRKVQSVGSEEMVYDTAGALVTPPSPNSFSFKNADKPNQPWVPNAENYPDGALRQAYEEEMKEMKRLEELERKTVETKAAYEKRKVEAEKEIAARRRTIEGYRLKQENLSSEYDMYVTELTEIEGKQKDVEGELKLVEARFKEVEAQHTDKASELTQTKKKLTSALESLRVTRENTAKNMNKLQIEMQQMRASVANAEVDIARIENDKTRLAADEIQLRSDYAALQARLEQTKADRVMAQAELTDLRRRVDVVRSEYNDAKGEFENSSRELAILRDRLGKEKVNTAVEIQNLERSIAQAKRWTAEAEAEKVRYESEADRLKQNLVLVRQKNSEIQAENSDAQSAVMESRLALETAKADIAKEMAAGQTAQLRNDQHAVKMRAIASMENAVGDTARPWVATRDCQVKRSPASNAEAGFSIKNGQKLIATPAGNGFVRIVNSSGRGAYVEGSCGSFAD
ncbi:MAG: hypothetical protein ACK5P6_04670 [Pseudobdellovibrionaceae bacterium]